MTAEVIVLEPARERRHAFLTKARDEEVCAAVCGCVCVAVAVCVAVRVAVLKHAHCWLFDIRWPFL